MKGKGKEVARELSNLVNTLSVNSPEADEFVEAVMHDHRTLQQLTGGLVFRLISNWAEAYDKGMYDPRNEHLCRCCAVLVQEHPEMFQQRMPLI